MFDCELYTNCIIGTMVNGYEIQSLLDKGTFCTVYRATNKETSHKAVVKFTQDKDAFDSELDVISQVTTHPNQQPGSKVNFVRVLGKGCAQIDDPTMKGRRPTTIWRFIVMEDYGINLAERVARLTLSVVSVT